MNGYKDFKFSQGTVERTLADMQSGASADFVRQYFSDDPEMLAFVNEQEEKRQALRTEKQEVQA